jgi:hypothetical protein
VRASVKYRAALRMFLYIRRRSLSQLSVLLVVVGLTALPLSGVRPNDDSILTPLATILVPFDANVEAPSIAPVHFSIKAIASERLALALSSSSLIAALDRSLVSSIEVDGGSRSTFVAFASGRSPPVAY